MKVLKWKIFDPINESIILLICNENVLNLWYCITEWLLSIWTDPALKNFRFVNHIAQHGLFLVGGWDSGRNHARQGLEHRQSHRGSGGEHRDRKPDPSLNFHMIFYGAKYFQVKKLSHYHSHMSVVIIHTCLLFSKSFETKRFVRYFFYHLSFCVDGDENGFEKTGNTAREFLKKNENFFGTKKACKFLKKNEDFFWHWKSVWFEASLFSEFLQNNHAVSGCFQWTAFVPSLPSGDSKVSALGPYHGHRGCKFWARPRLSSTLSNLPSQ